MVAWVVVGGLHLDLFHEARPVVGLDIVVLVVACLLPLLERFSTPRIAECRPRLVDAYNVRFEVPHDLLVRNRGATGVLVGASPSWASIPKVKDVPLSEAWPQLAICSVQFGAAHRAVSVACIESCGVQREFRVELLAGHDIRATKTWRIVGAVRR